MVASKFLPSSSDFACNSIEREGGCTNALIGLMFVIGKLGRYMQWASKRVRFRWGPFCLAKRSTHKPFSIFKLHVQPSSYDSCRYCRSTSWLSQSFYAFPIQNAVQINRDVTTAQKVIHTFDLRADNTKRFKTDDECQLGVHPSAASLSNAKPTRWMNLKGIKWQERRNCLQLWKLQQTSVTVQ